MTTRRHAHAQMPTALVSPTDAMYASSFAYHALLLHVCMREPMQQAPLV
jgi:hypothetical protein